jgi:glycosyltransferase involved in cell wall biosynthesis
VNLPLHYTQKIIKMIKDMLVVQKEKGKVTSKMKFNLNVRECFYYYFVCILLYYQDYVVKCSEMKVELYSLYLKGELSISDLINVKKYIKILPPRGDIHGIIRDCAMFVSSSDFEGLSNSMIEAMAIGLPCVCTDCLGGGAREMIRHGENGLLVPMNDADALCDAMKLMIEDSGLAQKCSQNAAKIRDELSADRIAQLWIDFIEKIA